MAKAGKNYGNESISLLEGAERVRKRPGVIFGSDGLDGCEHAVFEILSNSIDEAREGHGKVITLTHYADGSIEVEDNGPGMSEEIVEQLLKPTRDVSVPKAKGSGIGFRNVHQRIQLTFGNAYGLTIRSEPDNGTVVRICLPVLEEEDARKYRKEGER